MLAKSIINMKTLIVGDLHLCTSKNEEDIFLSEWLAGILNKTSPEHIVFAGDTFEISFCTQERAILSNPDEILRSILDTHHCFFDFLRAVNAIRKITFLVGEHDYLLLNKLRSQLAASFKEKEVCIEEYFYDEQSKLLAIHGHQLDYNLIPSYLSTEVLTDKLTRVFENFIFQDPQKTESLLQEYERQRFSFWYAAGNLPDYIDATHRIFGHDPDVYFRELSALLRSKFLREWLKDLRNPVNRRIGQLARLLSRVPPSLLRRLSRPWWALAQKIVIQRSLALLKGNVDRTLLDVEERLTIDKLVVGHTHHNQAIEFKYNGIEKHYYCTSSPRWYVRGIKDDHLELHRDSGFVVIEADARVSYVADNEYRNLPLYGGSLGSRQNRMTDLEFDCSPEL
jgi:UDP-2,3-diacylglucosamine pyrophosphatase LpxH